MTGRLSELCCIVVDEIQQISEPKRGCLLECLLSKVKFLASNIQLIAMSATVPKMMQLADWLDAHLFVTDFRPVPIQNLYKKTNGNVHGLYNIETGHKTPLVSHSLYDAKSNPIFLYSLIRQVTQVGKGVLIFCNSKEKVEITARKALELLKKEGEPQGSFLDRSEIMNQILDNELKEMIRYGIADHHAGLYSNEREMIEDAFSKGIIHTLPCTTTLAAGVNLPARRVIFNGIRFGSTVLDPIRDQQAAGRAGRMNLDNFGDSILLANGSKQDDVAISHILKKLFTF